MKLPVIIAAHNEAEYIGRTLAALPADLYDPIVVANACEETAQAAEAFGATTMRLETQGKLPAIQQGIWSLGERALSPFMLTDADSFPQFPRHYPRIMEAAAAQTEQPVVVTGPTRYVDGNSVVNGLRTARKYMQALSIPGNSDSLDHMFGFNMVVAARDQQAIDAILELPHIWLGDDRAIGKVILAAGGTRINVTHPYGTVATSARWHVPLRDRLRAGSNATTARIKDEYMRRAAPGSISFEDHFGQNVASLPE